MRESTFRTELRKSLRVPEDWCIRTVCTKDYLCHQGTGISLRVLRILQDEPVTIEVSSDPLGHPITTLRRSDHQNVFDCYTKVLKIRESAILTSLKANKEHFLKTFDGFERM